jgi:hypothetical protein
VCWWTRVIPSLGSLRQEECEFEANLDYRVRPCFIKTPASTSKLNSVNTAGIDEYDGKYKFERGRIRCSIGPRREPMNA